MTKRETDPNKNVFNIQRKGQKDVKPKVTPKPVKKEKSNA